MLSHRAQVSQDSVLWEEMSRPSADGGAADHCWALELLEHD